MKILVAYYSQTGQLERILNTIITALQERPEIIVDRFLIKPIKSYPFPWTSKEFFDEFPECVKGIPCDIEENTTNLSEDYDLIILGYQPWFLSLSRPMSSFLHLSSTKKIIKGKQIVTVIGCRNMWTQAQEMMKSHLKTLEARLVGNIVLRDKAYNLISVYTILRWMFYGKKGNSGISEHDIIQSKIYGDYIADCLLANRPIDQNKLVSLGAVKSSYNLIFLEKRAVILFRLFADFVLNKGEHANKKREGRLLIFKIYLFAGIILLSPGTFFITKILQIVFPRKVKKEIDYFDGV